jgi:hypothetical protein
MSESRLRTAVDERRDVSEAMWAYLEDEQKLKYALDEMEGSFKDRVNYLVSEIDRISATSPSSPGHTSPSGGVPYSRAFDYLGDYELERMEVRAEVLAKHAASDEAVQAFRERFLGGEVLTPEQAQAFVASLANQNLPVQWFDEQGVSFKEHTIETYTPTIDHRGQVIEFKVRPADIDCRVVRDPLSEEYGGGTTLSVAGDPSDVIERRRNDVPLPTPEEGLIARDGTLDLGYWRGFTGYVHTDSPLGVLRDLSIQLTKRYPGWKANHAARFVLTGEPPKGESPLWADRGTRGEIVLHVSPWISPESVKNAYTRELWFRGWMTEHYGGPKAKRRRRLSDKSLKLLRFITDRIDRIDHRGRRPNGRDVAAQWDATYPEWAYRGDTRTMWRDYNRALRQVVPTVVRKDPVDSDATVTRENAREH